jgi:hypothetical protein
MDSANSKIIFIEPFGTHKNEIAYLCTPAFFFCLQPAVACDSAKYVIFRILRIYLNDDFVLLLLSCFAQKWAE